jgi:hypothetical protein
MLRRSLQRVRGDLKRDHIGIGLFSFPVIHRQFIVIRLGTGVTSQCRMSRKHKKSPITMLISEPLPFWRHTGDTNCPCTLHAVPSCNSHQNPRQDADGLQGMPSPGAGGRLKTATARCSAETKSAVTRHPYRGCRRDTESICGATRPARIQAHTGEEIMLTGSQHVPMTSRGEPVVSLDFLASSNVHAYRAG